MNRKIDLPDYCSTQTGRCKGGNPQCDHDYPPNSEMKLGGYVSWECSKCGMERIYEVDEE